MLHRWINRCICLGLVGLLSACVGESVLTPVVYKAGAKPIKSRVLGPVASRGGFTELALDRRIAYQEGGKAMALKLQGMLDEKAAIIEQRQYSPFTKPIYVYVVTAKDGPQRYCASRLARGCVVNQRLFITRRGENTLASLLQHELSHLHFEQKMGMFRYHSQVPAWFQEGLAVVVSDGAGAEKISFVAAIVALRIDKSITPNDRRSLLFPKKAAQFGINNSMFYAQSGIFVKYLQQQNPQGFKNMVLSISVGQGFAKSIAINYGKTLDDLWGAFKAEVASSDIASLNRYNFK